MLSISSNPDRIKNAWDTAIERGSILVQELRMPYKKQRDFGKLKTLYGLNASKYLFFQIFMGISLFVPEVVLKNIVTALSQGWFYIFKLVVLGLLLGFGPATLKAIKIYFMFGDQFKRTAMIGQTVLSYMKQGNLLTSTAATVSMVAQQKKDGSFSIYLKDANQHDGNLFVKLLAEIIDPIDNPRYLILVDNWMKRLFGYKNYYAVPDQIGRSKKVATTFFTIWKTKIGGSELKYTRNVKGRKMLLKARFAHLKYQFENKPERSTSWK